MKPNIILTKQELDWFIISNYLDDLSNFVVATNDEQFKKYFAELQRYVNEKFRLTCNGEIIDMFVLVLQESEN